MTIVIKPGGRIVRVGDMLVVAASRDTGREGEGAVLLTSTLDASCAGEKRTSCLLLEGSQAVGLKVERDKNEEREEETLY